MFATVETLESLINEIAPFETAEAFDNPGLLAGRRDAKVTRILVALDATLDVVHEAERLGAELIVSHHPLFFHGRKNLVEEDPEAIILCEMVRSHIALISAHTNLDKTVFSGSAACAKLLGLENLRQDGYLFLGDLPEPISAAALKCAVEQRLHAPVRQYGGDAGSAVSTLAIAGGADDEDWENAKRLGAQVLLTGEVRHHNALAAAMSGFILFDGGHYATEAPLVPVLAEYLQKRLNDVKYDVRVFASECAPFGALQ